MSALYMEIVLRNKRKQNKKTSKSHMHVIKKIMAEKAILRQLFSVIFFFFLWKSYKILQAAQVKYGEENLDIPTIHGWFGLTWSQMSLSVKTERIENTKECRTHFRVPKLQSFRGNLYIQIFPVLSLKHVY